MGRVEYCCSENCATAGKVDGALAKYNRVPTVRPAANQHEEGYGGRGRETEMHE